MHRARYWDPVSETKVRCLLCPQHCLIEDGSAGFCRARVNYQGELYSENYGKVSSIALDPIEKKPLYHYKPGSQILSVGSYGCNLRCLYCQNYSISQQKVSTRYFDPASLLALLERFENNIGIAFTYNEPLIWYEYVYDVAKLIKDKRPETSVVLVTNGYINQEPLKELLPYIDALNIDLKSFSDKIYKKLCKGRLDPVLETIQTARRCHLEITALLVTDENDSHEEIHNLASFLARIDKNIPLHLSRYYPNFLLNKPATPGSSLLEAREIASEYLNYVYIGNYPEADTNTYCPNCGKLLIERKYYQTKVKIKSPNCTQCGKGIPIIL